MKTYALILLAVLSASCAPKAIVVEPIAPRAVVVEEATAVTATQATKVKKNTEEIGAKVKEMQAEVVKARNEADRLRKIGAATQDELDANAEAWADLSVRNLFLEATVQNATIDAKELEQAAARAKSEAAALRIEAGKADKQVVDLKSVIAEQSVDAARGRMVKHGIWLLIGIAGLYLVIRFVLPLVKPL